MACSRFPESWHTFVCERLEHHVAAMLPLMVGDRTKKTELADSWLDEAKKLVPGDDAPRRRLTPAS